MKAIALDLASKLHAYADELTEACVYEDYTDLYNPHKHMLL